MRKRTVTDTKKSDKRIMLYIQQAIRPNFGSLSGIQTFEFNFVTYDKDDHVRNISNSSYDNPYSGFADLEFYSQANYGTCEGKLYAQSLRFKNSCGIEADDVERMHKMFQRIAKVVAKFPVQPETFGQYIQLMCIGLGVHGAVQEGQQVGSSESNYDHRLHNVWKVTEIQWLVDRRVNEFFEAHGAKMKAYAA